MKRIAFFVAALCCTINSFSQANFGIKGGLNIANQRLSASGNGMSASTSASSIVAFQVGGFADISMSKDFSFNPELLLSSEGANFSDNATGTPIKPRLYYLRIPLNLLFVAPIPNKSQFFFGAGPDFGFGLFGKTSVSGQSTNSFQDSLFKRFDFGLNFVAGIQANSGFRFSFSYYLGLSSISTPLFNSLIIANSPEITSFKWRNFSFSFSVGYIINNGKVE
jgi:hypothetical protein